VTTPDTYPLSWISIFDLLAQASKEVINLGFTAQSTPARSMQTAIQFHLCSLIIPPLYFTFVQPSIPTFPPPRCIISHHIHPSLSLIHHSKIGFHSYLTAISCPIICAKPTCNSVFSVLNAAYPLENLLTSSTFCKARPSIPNSDSNCLLVLTTSL
jgi:hypothetical protein